MPDYVPSFACKMGACRSACCRGWPVSFSLEDYFRLINEDCSPALRERLDRGVRPVFEPSPDRYAELVPTYEGKCPMRLADGRCAIHAELGEGALADVCRLYPRGIRREEDGYEISCANSCEAVAELFLGREEPLTFIDRELTVELPPLAERRFFFDTHGHEREVRLKLIRVMQDRRLTLPERLTALEKQLITLERAMAAGPAALSDWLAAGLHDTPALPQVARAYLEEGLDTAEMFIRLIDERSASVRAYGEEALARFQRGIGAFERYLAAKEQFEAGFPRWDIFFEHLLVNHMFFSCFPFEDRPEDLCTEYMAICSVYTLLRFLAVGCASNGDAARLTDVCAAAFRLIEHTAFDIYASHLLTDLGWTTDGKLTEWIIL